MGRYEWTNADTLVLALPNGTRLNGELINPGVAVVLGDPGATALVVEGRRSELLLFADRIRTAVLNLPGADDPQTRTGLVEPLGTDPAYLAAVDDDARTIRTATQRAIIEHAQETARRMEAARAERLGRPEPD